MNLWSILMILLIGCVLLYFLTYVLPKTIWVYWDSEELPPLIARIRAYNAERLRGWTIRWLSRRTVGAYISEASFPVAYKTLSVQHQADWIRLFLLKNYGGCWLDAAIILNDPTALDRIWSQSVVHRSALTAFATGTKTFVHSSGIRLPLVVDNWFLMAPPGSDVIHRWFSEYTAAVEMGFLAYKRKAVLEGVNISGIRFKSEEDVYLTQHICIEKVLQTLPGVPSMVFLHSKDSMFRLQLDCGWKEDCFRRRLLEPEAKRLPYIKLIGANRDATLLSYFDEPVQ